MKNCNKSGYLTERWGQLGSAHPGSLGVQAPRENVWLFVVKAAKYDFRALHIQYKINKIELSRHSVHVCNSTQEAWGREIH